MGGEKEGKKAFLQLKGMGPFRKLFADQCGSVSAAHGNIHLTPIIARSTVSSYAMILSCSRT
jgi:hypothetical protein